MKIAATFLFKANGEGIPVELATLYAVADDRTKTGEEKTLRFALCMASLFPEAAAMPKAPIPIINSLGVTLCSMVSN